MPRTSRCWKRGLSEMDHGAKGISYVSESKRNTRSCDTTRHDAAFKNHTTQLCCVMIYCSYSSPPLIGLFLVNRWKSRAGAHVMLNEGHACVYECTEHHSSALLSYRPSVLYSLPPGLPPVMRAEALGWVAAGGSGLRQATLMPRERTQIIHG